MADNDKKSPPVQDNKDTKATDDAAAKAAAEAAAAEEARKKAAAEGGGDDVDPPGEGGEESPEGGEAEDWRTRLAGGDEATLKFLNRFTDEGALGRHIMESEKRIREKGGIKPPKADAPLEEKAKFYTEHFGRPEKVEDLAKLDLAPKLEEGEELSGDEQTSLAGVQAMMHKSGVFGEEQMRAAGQIFADLAVGGRKQQEKIAESFREESEKNLRKTDAWGRDYDANLTLATNYMQMRCQQAGVDARALATTRLANGALLGDDPLFLKVMALGGRDHHEDPLMNRAESSGSRSAEIQDALNKEMAKRNGTPAERKYYDSAEGKARRLKLRNDLKRLGGGGGAKPAAKSK